MYKTYVQCKKSQIYTTSIITLPHGGVQSNCDESVGRSVGLSVHIGLSSKRTAELYQIFVHVASSHGSPRHCDMLCTSGFMDDVVSA